MKIIITYIDSTQEVLSFDRKEYFTIKKQMEAFFNSNSQYLYIEPYAIFIEKNQIRRLEIILNNN